MAFVVYAVSLTMVSGTEVKHSRGWGRALGVRDEAIGVARDVDDPAEFSNMLLSPWENVIVFDPSPQINEPSAVLALHDILGRDKATKWRKPSLEFKFGGNSSSDYVGLYCGEIEPIRKSAVEDFAINVGPHSSCWGVSTIAQHGSELPSIHTGDFVLGPSLVEGCNENKGFLVSYQRFPGELSLTTCCHPQCSGECGDEECSDGGDGRILTTYVSSGAPGSDDAADDELGQTFRMLWGACFCILFGLALLKFR